MCKKLANGVYRYCPSRQPGARAEAKKKGRSVISTQITAMSAALPEHGSPRRPHKDVDHLNEVAYQWLQDLEGPEHDALYDYTGEDAVGWNGVLNDHQGVLPPDHEYAEKINDLDNALDACPQAKEPHIVYRGVEMWGAGGRTPAQWADDTFPVGENIVFPSFASTSTHPGMAANFGGIGAKHPVGIVFEISTRQQAYVEDVTQNPGEYEVLLRRNTRFKVVGIDHKAVIPGGYKDRKDVTVVQLVEITDPHDTTA